LDAEDSCTADLHNASSSGSSPGKMMINNNEANAFHRRKSSSNCSTHFFPPHLHASSDNCEGRFRNCYIRFGRWPILDRQVTEHLVHKPIISDLFAITL